MAGDSALWNTYFTTPFSQSLFNRIHRGKQIYVHPDIRKSRLLLYGGSKFARAEVENELYFMAVEFRHILHEIILVPGLLKRAMHDGMKKLERKYGTRLVLNVFAEPKAMTIYGPSSDVNAALLVIMESPIFSPQKNEDYIVCWSEAKYAFHTQYGHTYCQDCFANQVAPAGDCEVPLRCRGNEGRYEQVFSIDKLRSVLYHTAFEELLAVSFESYICMHQEDFQHCSTPDCRQVYRVTGSGGNHLCSACYASASTTTCQANHDGRSFQSISAQEHLEALGLRTARQLL